ncbi:MAG: NAD-dependent epimerase/dehydratase family protein [Gemmatimonadetes bacterium]|nr:NAD-dependent epimerase/dehydratase family protein [Gemmatimonadota bacterium]
MIPASVPSAPLAAPRTEEELEERLSRPNAAVVEALRQSPGDVVVVGAGGKMGPSLTAMLRRAADALGDGRRIFAVSRWGSAKDAARLEAMGIEVVRADLLDPDAVDALPDAPNVVFMAGQKFGTHDAPSLTWMTNTVVPAYVARRYRHARIVAFSTGNVYGLSPVDGTGSREDDPLAPVGEYAASCVGRERVFEDAATRWGTRVTIIRLNYAVDLRYGVLVDLARRILADEAVDLGMGYVNCIWQGDANAMALAALASAATPPFVLNVTGAERLSVRALALALGDRLGRTPTFTNAEAPDALLSDTRRAQSLVGLPEIDGHTLAAWVAEWLRLGGRTLGKPTRFERRDGTF